MNLLYHLWRRHNLTPGEFYNLPAGERILLNAFAALEIEQRKGAGR